jgi:hypothetical protein
MNDTKIEINVAGIVFSGQGEEKWLSAQLDKILATAAELSKLKPTHAPATLPAIKTSAVANVLAPSGSTLASYIKAKSGDANQVKRFLAAAHWLQLRGETVLTTAKVAKALADNQQKRLANPSDALNQNVRKGHCEKTATGFFITPDGLSDLGIVS